jgi:hypothetical protein
MVSSYNTRTKRDKASDLREASAGGANDREGAGEEIQESGDER